MVLNEWQRDWSANNNDAYLNHYHPDFTDARRNLQQWKTYKTRINKSKRYISVKLSQVSIIAYPGEENLVSSRFYQTIRAATLAGADGNNFYGDASITVSGKYSLKETVDLHAPNKKPLPTRYSGFMLATLASCASTPEQESSPEEVEPLLQPSAPVKISIQQRSEPTPEEALEIHMLISLTKRLHKQTRVMLLRQSSAKKLVLNWGVLVLMTACSSN